MKFIKSDDGERVYAVNSTGITVAYIEKNRMGTHGHWHGWMHYKYCYYHNRFIRTDVFCKTVFPGWDRGFGYFDSWSSDRTCFTNIKEFKEHYQS